MYTRYPKLAWEGKRQDFFFFFEFQDWHIDGLVQERRNSSANALELRLSCTNPSKSPTFVIVQLYAIPGHF